MTSYLKKYPVTAFKVKKAIESGVDHNVQEIVNATGRPEMEVHRVMMDLFPTEFGIVGLSPPRTTVTIDELVAYAREFVDRCGLQALIEYDPYFGACCCVGHKTTNRCVRAKCEAH